MSYKNDNVVHGPPALNIYKNSIGKYLYNKLKEANGELPALINGDTNETLTYSQVLNTSISVARALCIQYGLLRGDVVAICSENRWEYTVTALAILYCDGVITNYNPAYSIDETKHVLRISKPKFIFCSQANIEKFLKLRSYYEIEKFFVYGVCVDSDVIEFSNLLDAVDNDSLTIADTKRDDVAVINYSSGTTGLPKGVRLSHCNILVSALIFSGAVAFNKTSIDNVLIVVPWYHAYGFITMFGFIQRHVTVVYQSKFRLDNYLQCIQNFKISTILAVPPILVLLYKTPLLKQYHLSSLKIIMSGAATLATEVYENLKNKFEHDVNIYESYGLTETTAAIIMSRDTNNYKSIGQLMPGVKAKVVNEMNETLGPNKSGELLLKGDTVMLGYVDNTDVNLFDSEGYIRTGDMVYYDETEHFYFVDRIKELIKYKGHQVPPAELENILMRHPCVMDCCVVGKPDLEAGELPTAFVVLKDNHKVMEKELIQYVSSEISPMKHLRGGVIFIEQIPKTPSGKKIRRHLKQILKNSHQTSKL